MSEIPVLSAAWWLDAPRLAEGVGQTFLSGQSYRFGSAILDVDSAYQPLLDDLESAYGDCAVARDTPSAVRVHAAVRFIEERSLAVVRFQSAAALPNLAEIARAIVHPRAELQHFQLRDSDIPGWRLIANQRDEEAPLLIADTHSAIVDLRQEPGEFLVNLLVGATQLAQPSMLFVHGGGVVIDGRGALLVGGSGKGKSTTTVALASRGHALLGDETVGVQMESCELWSFRRTIKLRPGPRPQEVVERLKVVPHGFRIDAHGVVCAWVKPGALFPGTPPVSAPLRDVFFLRSFSDRAAVERFEPSLDHLPDLHALTMTLSAVVSWPLSPAHRLMRFARVIDLFKKCRCYFLDLGTPDETAALIQRTVQDT